MEGGTPRPNAWPPPHSPVLAMIAVVSSTVSPSSLPSHDGARTTLSPEVRLEQTRATVASLVALGAEEIIIADNSPGHWLRDRLSALAPARVIHLDQPPIRNKGIGEQWLLLGALEHLSANRPILKISGRYKIGAATDLALKDGEDIAAKVYAKGRVGEISTRCYLVRDKSVATRLWNRSLDEMYAERSRIVGPRSLLRIVTNSIHPERDNFTYSDPNTLSLEQASLRAVRYLGLRLRAVDNLDVEGILGSWINPLVKE
jgi:hypothetical protein